MLTTAASGRGGSNRMQQRIAQEAFGPSMSISHWRVLWVLLGSFLGNLGSSITNVALSMIAHGNL